MSVKVLQERAATGTEPGKSGDSTSAARTFTDKFEEAVHKEIEMSNMFDVRSLTPERLLSDLKRKGINADSVQKAVKKKKSIEQLLTTLDFEEAEVRVVLQASRKMDDL